MVVGDGAAGGAATITSTSTITTISTATRTSGAVIAATSVAAIVPRIQSLGAAIAATSAELVVLVVPAVLVVLAGSVELVVLAALAASVVLAALVVLVAEIARQLSRLADAATGSTIRNIAVELRIGIGRLRTGLGARPAVTLSPTAKPMPGNSWADKVAIWPATEREERAREIGLAAGALATGRLEAEGIE